MKYIKIQKKKVYLHFENLYHSNDLPIHHKRIIINYNNMKWFLFKQRFVSACAKTTGIAATIGGAYGLFKDLINPGQSIQESLTSPIAICVYILLLLTAVFVLLNEKYKSLQRDNEKLNKKVEELNLELNIASAKIESSLRNGQIATFKDRFFLTTPKLYADLSEKIHNEIVISHMDIHNTIEPTGIGAKRDSVVKLSIQGYAKAENVSQIQILAAGDTIVKWEDINLTAYEIVNENKVKLNARLADNGQDSFLKQVVISYARKKNKGDMINIVITWKWPNMLNIEDEDYIALPIALSSETKVASLTIHPLVPLKYAETGVYKYRVGQMTAEHIMDLTPDQNNSFTYLEDNPEYKSCLLLYYKVKR